MSSLKIDEDEPVTPAGRLFLQQQMEQVINCAVGMKHPIDFESFKVAIKDSIMIQHPRFRSLYVKDKHGREHWRKLEEVDLDKHILEKNISKQDYDHEDDEDIINAYIADLSVSSPLNIDKPLWEIHALKAQKCFILRIHHSLGDGVSLMSLFLTCCRRVGNPEELPNIPSASSTKEKSNMLKKFWRFVMVFWLTLVYILKFIVRSLWVKDEKTVITGGNGVELWPRKLATAKFKLDDMKLVKNAVNNATINDVLFGVVSSGLTRYLDLQSSKKIKEGLQITGLAMVNIRKQPGLQEFANLMKDKSSSRWGNQFGFIQLPLYYYKGVNDPLQYVKRTKAMLDRKKLSLEAYFSYRIGKLVMSLLGPKVAAWLNYRIICNTSFTISNVVGPQEEIMFAENPITYMRVNSTSLAHAITMHMVSYNGNAYMQILVPKDIIPDPKVLVKCFQDALLEMKNATTTTTKIKEGTISNGTVIHS
ncbi:hypothetical protein AQUCO_01500011v1 [Aquilegia coerulea]|uniref:Uncharacterized protein n=1 Tax=Aquilegia coerulea TaxID=218851 RepID=A0A2G5DRZ1_AQUCA|nr:hypothetical protein AQUCO_01500011v1 [Aquilegia coerulea]